MIDRRFIALFIISFSIAFTSGFLWWKLFYEPECVQTDEQDRNELKNPAAYKEIDMIIPVQEFLNRGANSTNVSTVKRIVVNQWIYFNQDDLIKLAVYAKGSTSFEEMQKALTAGIQENCATNGAASFITGTLNAIEKDPKLIEHVNKSLKQGLSPEIHALRGKIMETEYNSRTYKKLKAEYSKAFYEWINEKHGELLDELILQF